MLGVQHATADPGDCTAIEMAAHLSGYAPAIAANSAACNACVEAAEAAAGCSDVDTAPAGDGKTWNLCPSGCENSDQGYTARNSYMTSIQQFVNDGRIDDCAYPDCEFGQVCGFEENHTGWFTNNGYVFDECATCQIDSHSPATPFHQCYIAQSACDWDGQGSAWDMGILCKDDGHLATGQTIEDLTIIMASSFSDMQPCLAATSSAVCTVISSDDESAPPCGFCMWDESQVDGRKCVPKVELGAAMLVRTNAATQALCDAPSTGTSPWAPPPPPAPAPASSGVQHSATTTLGITTVLVLTILQFA
eukprot:SAG31_NODE_1266_length_9065_cov_44.433939_1_plen_306_part_00